MNRLERRQKYGKYFTNSYKFPDNISEPEDDFVIDKVQLLKKMT